METTASPSSSLSTSTNKETPAPSPSSSDSTTSSAKSTSISDTSSLTSRILTIAGTTTTASLLQTSTLPSASSSSTSVSSTIIAVVADVPESTLNRNAWIGGVVGAFVGGLFIGFFAGFIILWRQTHKDELEYELSMRRPDRKSLDSRGLTCSPTQPPTQASTSTFGLNHFLALPMSDKDLVGELRSLGHLIEQHVEDNYHLVAVTQHAESLSDVLSDLGLASSKKGVPGSVQLASMAIDPETRPTALQHIITRVIFASMSAESIRNSFGKLSLLPASITSMINSIAPCEQHVGNEKAVSAALTRWRQLSAFLLNPKRSDRGCLVPDEQFLKPQAREIVAALNSALGAFVTEGMKDDQERHLLEVILECAKLGYMIFSQPAEYVYLFGSADEKHVVVCPGLQKTSDENGVSSKVETVVAPERHEIDAEL